MFCQRLVDIAAGVGITDAETLTDYVVIDAIEVFSSRNNFACCRHRFKNAEQYNVVRRIPGLIVLPPQRALVSKTHR